MQKFWTNPIVVGALGGVLTNAVWSLLSNIATLQPYIPALATPVSLPAWEILGVAGFTAVTAVSGLMTHLKLLRLQGARFAPNDVELAILVGLRATDRPVPDEALQDHIYKQPDSPFGREDVRVALRRLHDAGWLCYQPMGFDDIANALTDKSLAHMRKLGIGPVKRQPEARPGSV